MALTFRLIKGSPLTTEELDDNFRYVYEWGSAYTYEVGMMVLYTPTNIQYTAKTSVPANVIPGSESEPTTYWELVGASDFDFDGTREITRVGIPNVTPGGTKASTFLENFFYPSKAPGLSIALTNPVREFGSSNSVSISYEATKWTKGITAITINGQSQVVGSNINSDNDTPGTTQSGPTTSSVTANVNASLSALVTTATEATSVSTPITWLGKKFLTSSSTDYFTPSANDATISTFLNALGSGFSLSADRLQNAPVVCANQYVYLLYLNSLGGDIDYNFLINGMVTDAWDVKTFTYTNQFGYTSTYRLVKTKYLLTGEFLIEVR